MNPEAAGLAQSEPGGSAAALRALRAYRAQRGPGSGGEPAGLSEHDALALTYLLPELGPSLAVLDVGAGLGATAAHLAALPTVARVLVVDLDAKEAPDAVAGTPTDRATGKIELTPLRPGGGLPALAAAAAGGGPVALLEGLHERPSVRRALQAVFEASPDALALLAGCRGGPGPFVQAGVADLLEATPGRYRFRLLCDLGPALAGCGLGAVWRAAAGPHVEEALARFAGGFTRQFDVLALLEREAELASALAARAHELAESRGRLTELRDTLDLVLKSGSWRLTRPLRLALAAARRLARTDAERR